MGLFSKMFGGNKSEKDVRAILPQVTKINQHFSSYESLSNDELRNKTQEFRQRIAQALVNIDAEIIETSKKGDELSFTDLVGKDAIYQQVDKLKKDRDQKIEDVLKEILPEAFAVVKEVARRFKENTELVSTATDLDRNLSVQKN
jgi:preprotein translocase subunit SecA